MKILIENADGANHYISKSYVNSCRVAGFDVIWWDHTSKSSYDVFQENYPIDLALLNSWKLNRATVNNLIKYKDIKVALRIPHWGSGDSEIDQTLYPIQFATDEEKSYVEKLVKNCPNLKFGFCQYHEDRISNTHDLWNNIGLTPKGILLSADVTEYFPVPKDNDYYTNWVFQGGYWSYKATNIDRFLLPLTYPNTIWKIKIFGNGWNSPHFLGHVTTESMRKFYRAADVSPNIFEPHSVTYGKDVNQRSYEIPACMGLQIAQRVQSLQEDVFNEDEIILVDSPKEFFDRVCYFLNHPEETEPYRRKGCLRVFRDHQNFHRASTLMRLLEEDEAANKLLQIAYSNYDKVNQLIGDSHDLSSV